MTLKLLIQVTTNISTATNPMHVVPHHHGWESICIHWFSCSNYICTQYNSPYIIILMTTSKKIRITTAITFVVSPSITTAR